MDTSTVIALPLITDAASLPVEPVITAVTLANDLPVYTANPRDFHDIDGLDVVEVAVPASR